MEDAAYILRRARLKAGLSQHALAEKLGIKQPMVSRIETGSEQPSLQTLSRLVRACGYEIDAEIRPVIDPHDLGLMESSIALTPQERIDRLIDLHRLAGDLQHAVFLAKEGRVE